MGKVEPQDGGGMNDAPVFCCPFMATLFASRNVRLRPLSHNNRIVAHIGSLDEYVPLNFCPSCGKEFRLTFLTDSEVDE